MRKKSETSRRTVLKTVGAGIAGGVAFAGSAAADKPDIDRSVEVTVFNPCTGENATDTDARENTDTDIRTDNSGGQHINFKFSGKARLVGEDSGIVYEGSINGSENVYVSAGETPTTETVVFRFKVISRGSADNFLVKLNAHLTVNANGVTTVDTEYSSEECL
jgi:hypothetical protein